MKSRGGRGRTGRPLLGNHQRCWIYGRHAVCEMIRAGRWPAHEVLLSEEIPPAEREELCGILRGQDVPFTVVTATVLAKRCGSGSHQGFAAKMEPFPLDEASQVLQQPPPPLALLLDAIQDAFNFGAILRSAEGLGIGTVYLQRQGQASVSSQVARSSAGAVNHLTLAATDDLVATARQLRERGVRLVGATEKGRDVCGRVPLEFPAVLVIGSEGSGIRAEILELCETTVAVPMAGRVGSLNAAVAAGILMYEATRQLSDSSADG